MSKENVAKIPEEVIREMALYVISTEEGEYNGEDKEVIAMCTQVLAILDGEIDSYTPPVKMEWVTLTDDELRDEKKRIMAEIKRDVDARYPIRETPHEVIPTDKIEEDFLATLENLRNSLEQQNS